jgi:hypothetical protein
MKVKQEAPVIHYLHFEIMDPPKKQAVHIKDRPAIKAVFSMWDNIMYINLNANPTARTIRVVK